MAMLEGLQDSRAERRALLVIIAGLVIATSVGMGFVYLKVFREAASDLTRILPDRTATWLGLELQQGQLVEFASAAIWREPTRVAALFTQRPGARLARAGDDAGPSDVGGLPTTLARDLLHAATRLELAWIPPAPDGSTDGALLAFVAIDDAVTRRRLLSRLEARATLEGRYVGYRIDSVEAPLWQRWLGGSEPMPRAVFVDPWLVLAWGDPLILEELLAARVEGREDAIRRRPGFEGPPREPAAPAAPDGSQVRLRGALAPPAGHASAEGPWRALIAEALPGAVISQLGPVNLSGEVSARGELARVRGPLGDAPLPTRLALATAMAPHELLPAGPSGSRLALSFTTRDVAATTPHLLALTPLAAALPGGFLPSPPPSDAVAAVASALSALPAAAADAPPLELAWFVGPGPDDAASWALLARHPDPAALAEGLGGALEQGASEEAGGGLALARVERPDGALHLLTAAAPPGEGSAERRQHLVWGARAGLFVAAPDLPRFEQVCAALADGDTLGRGPLGAPLEARGARALSLWLSPEVLRAAARGPLQLVTEQLAPSVPLAATFAHDVESFELSTNLGPWTALTALLATPRAALDALLVASLPEVCRSHHAAMCQAFPQAVACNPYASAREDLVARTCDALLAARRAPADPSPRPEPASPP